MKKKHPKCSRQSNNFKVILFDFATSWYNSVTATLQSMTGYNVMHIFAFQPISSVYIAARMLIG